jgi:hypothetical protein
MYNPVCHAYAKTDKTLKIKKIRTQRPILN